MSLAPTLATERSIAPGRAIVVAAGLAIAIASNVARPAQGAPRIVGNVPTVQQVTGPQARPARATLTLNIPGITLGRMRIIAPSLPEGTGVDNDLTPTLLIGTSEVNSIPQRAPLSIAGFVPGLQLDGSQTIYPTVSTSPPWIAGYTPTLVFPAQYDPRQPFRLTMTLYTYRPTLIREKQIETAAMGVLTSKIRGFAPDIQARYSWQTVALGGEAVWTEVPRAF